MIGCICAREIIRFTKVIPLKIGDAGFIEKEFHPKVSVKKKKESITLKTPKNKNY